LTRREFQHLKQDWMQLLGRFNVLDDHLAGGVEGIHVLTEVCILHATYYCLRQCLLR